MPRPNQPRSIASEEVLARRIAYEREARGMSYEGLAFRMTSAGCAIQASGLYKIEKAGRRITVDELVAFAQVFGVPIEHLLLPPEAVTTEELGRRLLKWHNAYQEELRAGDVAKEAWIELREYVSENPEAAAALEPILRKWADAFFENDQEFHVAHKMWQLTKDPEWGARAKATFDAMVEGE